MKLRWDRFGCLSYRNRKRCFIKDAFDARLKSSWMLSTAHRCSLHRCWQIGFVSSSLKIRWHGFGYLSRLWRKEHFVNDTLDARWNNSWVTWIAHGWSLHWFWKSGFVNSTLKLRCHGFGCLSNRCRKGNFVKDTLDVRWKSS